MVFALELKLPKRLNEIKRRSKNGLSCHFRRRNSIPELAKGQMKINVLTNTKFKTYITRPCDKGLIWDNVSMPNAEYGSWSSAVMMITCCILERRHVA